MHRAGVSPTQRYQLDGIIRGRVHPHSVASLSCGFGEGDLRFGLGVAFEVAGVLGVGVVTPLARPGSLAATLLRARLLF
jgi:hypothetical protein